MSALTPPVPPVPIPPVGEVILSFPDYISPGHWTLWAMEKVCGCNPAEWIAEQVAGDWEKVAAAGVALERLAEFYRSFGDAIGEEIAKVSTSWSGEAAGATVTWFSNLAVTLHGQAEPLRKIGDDFRVLAYGVYAAVKSVVSLLELLLDCLLAMAASAAAGALTAATGVGAVLGGAGGVIAFLKAASVWQQIIEVHGKVVAACMGLVGMVAGTLGAVSGLEQHPLPAGAYRAPATP